MPQTETLANDRLAELIGKAANGLTHEFLDLVPTPPRLVARPDEIYDLDDDELARAAMCAILLGQPLILTGEPGVGKTQFAEALAARLGRRVQPAHYVKSNSAGRDFLYVFDEVKHFRSKEDLPLCEFVRFNALGRAILWSAGPDAPAILGNVALRAIAGDMLAEKCRARGAGPTLAELFPDAFEVDRAGGGREIIEAQQSFVLIDELDKAPRDAPNDILHEIDRMAFLIEEIDLRVAANPSRWPIVVITSNSERSLPEAFQRRCVFHWIGFPKAERLRKIVARHCSLVEGAVHSPDEKLFAGAVKIFEEHRKGAINKPPATAELISFVHTLRAAGLPLDEEPKHDAPAVRHALGVLLKTKVDLENGRLASDAPRR